jgi:hypothetical protein
VSSQTTGGVPAYSVYCERADLPAGEASTATFTVVVSGDVTCGAVENAVGAKASNEPAANTANNTASVSVGVGCPPSIALTKHAPSFALVGDRITFTLRATNSGRIALDDVRVADPGCGSAPSIVANGNGDETLDPHEVWVYRCRATITSATPHLFSTTATVTGHSPDGTARGFARASVRVAHPRVAISVTASPVSGSPGDVITYTYVVRNRGDVALSDLIVSDDRLGKIGVIAQLSPGHAATLRATRELSATDVWVVNTATVVGIEPSGRSVTAAANAAISLVAATSDGTTGTGSGGTAFTGSPARTPAALGLFLGLLGLALVVGSRRRA